MGGDIHRAEGALWGFNSSLLLFCSIFPSLAENLHPLLVHLTFQLAMSGMDLCSVALRSMLAHIQLRGEHWEVSNTNQRRNWHYTPFTWCLLGLKWEEYEEWAGRWSHFQRCCGYCGLQLGQDMCWQCRAKKGPRPTWGCCRRCCIFNVSVSKLPGTLYRRTTLIQ